MNKRAFTLAEVLITLAIIGVVAALTLPTLIKNIQDAQFKNAAKEAFSKASQAVQQIKIDNGGDLSSYYATANSFKPVFMKYFKVSKDCGWHDCVVGADASSAYNNLYGTPGATWFMTYGQFVTTDGMFWAIYNVGDAYGSYLIITVDVNGYTQKPNIFGRDVFMFQVLNDNLVPMGSKNTFCSTATYCNANGNTGWQGLACMDFVMRGINY